MYVQISEHATQNVDCGRRLDSAVGPARNLLPVLFQLRQGLRPLGEWHSHLIWIYWTGFLVLIAAQFSAELLQERRARLAPEIR
jgi:hypothetical protein